MWRSSWKRKRVDRPISSVFYHAFGTRSIEVSPCCWFLAVISRVCLVRPLSFVLCPVSCVPRSLSCVVSFVLRVQLADGFNGADLRNIGTEAGLFAIRADRDYVLEVRQDRQGRRMGQASRASLQYTWRFWAFCRSVP